MIGRSRSARGVAMAVAGATLALTLWWVLPKPDGPGPGAPRAETSRADVPAPAPVVRPGAPNASAEALPADPGVPQAVAAVADAAHEDLLRRRTGDMTFERARADLLRWGRGGRMPDHNRWLWRVTGLLELRPELARDFADLVRGGALGPPGDALVFDLLANVGHPEAQAALRELIADPALRGRADAPGLVQRLVLLRDPEPETVDFLAARYAAEDGPSRRATAAALGATLGRLAERDPARVAAPADRLVRDLGAASDPDERRALLTAAGNAGLDSFVPEVRRALAAPAPEVRAAAARALRRMGGPAETDALLATLTADEDAAVQRAAATALAERSLTDEQLLALAEALGRGAPLPPEAVHPLIASLVRQADALGPEGVLPALEALAARPDLDREAGHRVVAELRRLRARTAAAARP